MTCNLWINKDISVDGEDQTDGCFHLNNCYVRLSFDWDGSTDVGFAMGTSAPDGYREICIDELSDDIGLWRAAKEHMNDIAVSGGYLHRVGQYLERRKDSSANNFSRMFVSS